MSERKGIYRSIFAFVTFVIPYFGLRLLINPVIPNWFTFDKILYNIPFLSTETTGSALIANFHTVVFLGPLFVLTIMHYKKHPQFLRKAVYISPLFILLHYLLGSIIEARLWLPLLVVVLPTSMNTLNILFNDVSFTLANQRVSH
jgi:hypothetical protein